MITCNSLLGVSHITAVFKLFLGKIFKVRKSYSKCCTVGLSELKIGMRFDHRFPQKGDMTSGIDHCLLNMSVFNSYSASCSVLT